MITSIMAYNLFTITLIFKHHDFLVVKNEKAVTVDGYHELRLSAASDCGTPWLFFFSVSCKDSNKNKGEKRKNFAPDIKWF